MLDKALAIIDPFEQAFFIMVHLPYLQPFEDVNKRTSRLAANIPFIKQNLCPLSFIDVTEKAYVDGILAVYESNEIDMLRDVFIWAYERSCAQYSQISQSLCFPEPVRMQYRREFEKVIFSVVSNRMDKIGADLFVKQMAATLIAKEYQERFVELVEMELRYLYSGNIARYRIQLNEYELWEEVW